MSRTSRRTALLALPAAVLLALVPSTASAYPVLESHGSVIGPGGQSVMNDTDGDLIVYHYYDGHDNGTPKLGVNLLNWSSGWPVAY